MTNKSPYTITTKAADYLVKIVESLMRLEFRPEFKSDIKLHRENRLRTVHSSLAIEGNSLSLHEVKAVIQGKLVAGRQEEIKEVKNAYEAYDKIMDFDPYSVKDFLKAHSYMTQGLVKEAGKFRMGDVAVFDGEVAIHVGAPPQFVHKLIEDLLKWAKLSDLHPILKSAIVHYEIETIHSFSDGNGRMGRLWQTLLLAKWNGIFAWIPMESVLYQKRPKYYESIEKSREPNDSGVFIEYTLSAIYDMLILQEKHQEKHQEEHQEKYQRELNQVELSILSAFHANPLSKKELFDAIGIKGDSRAFKRNIKPLIDSELIEMTVPDKPTSKLQRYRLTDSGRDEMTRLRGNDEGLLFSGEKR